MKSQAQRLKAVVALSALFVAASSGCGNRKSDAEKPAELVRFEESIDVRKVWSSKVGGGSERLRLGLKPASDGAHVYAGSHDGQVAAFDIERGRKTWSVKLRLPLAAGPGYGDGLLAFGTTDGDLVVLDAQTGVERWRRAVGSEVIAAPAIAQGVVLLRSADGRLRGYSASGGAELWSVEQPSPTLSLRGNTAPRVAGTVVVSGFDNGRVGAYEIASGEPVWEVAIASPTGRSELERLVDVGAGMQVVGNDVYVAGYQGRAAGIDLRTGLVAWQHELSSYAGLGADFNNVYVTTEVGEVVALDRRGGTAVWRQEALRLRDVTAPARYGDALVVGDYDGYVHWLDPADGSFLARVHAAGDRITDAPLVVGEVLYVQGDDGTVAAYAVREQG